MNKHAECTAVLCVRRRAADSLGSDAGSVDAGASVAGPPATAASAVTADGSQSSMPVVATVANQDDNLNAGGSDAEENSSATSMEIS